MTGSDIREMFLRYFEGKGHRRVHSSSLVPANDPTLLFTNAGMNQFKDVFLGLEKRDHARATTAQKCVRAGGKHNDLENVGFTNRHHTFFEMLGNFSFGDYFKREAVAYAWELVTSKDWFGIEKEKLYVTFYDGSIPVFDGVAGVPRDDETRELWLGQGIPDRRIKGFGQKDNFWQMGDTGPCGPCSEIHYDMGPAASDQGHTDCQFGCECGRFSEIWNLVFMQFNRVGEGERDPDNGKYRSYKLEPLPRPSIDTGAGLERVTAVLQGKISNYDTDLFVPLIRRAAELCGVDLEKELKAESKTRSAASLRVIADHARACTFLISDGVLPSNEGRGYVLRKILRRGIRHGRLLGAQKPFMYEMAHTVGDQMKAAYPELIESAERVSKVIYEEERRFAHTLEIGLRRMNEEFVGTIRVWQDDLKRWAPHDVEQITEGLQGDERSQAEAIRLAAPILKKHVGDTFRVNGAAMFQLYDTFGLPLDFIQDATRDLGLPFQIWEFEQSMQMQRERARASWKGVAKSAPSDIIQNLRDQQFRFEGYERTKSENCKIVAIDRTTGPDSSLCSVVLDRTPFYAESGGQVGDVGWFYEPGTTAIVAEVLGCYFAIQGVRAHKLRLRRPININEFVDAVVNTGVRQSTMRNHTATHLLHAALRETLGKHVKQAGSLVDPQHLRFDFSHFTNVADEELQDIEDLANKEVLKNTKIQVIEDVPLDVAINEYKAMALFGEKYGERVRVIKIGDFSTELCGGTHTAQTGEIGLVKILSEGSVSSGVRRVEAVTGEGSLRHFRQDHELERAVATLVRGDAAVSPAEALKGELEKREEEIKKLKKELDQARMKSAASSVASAEENVRVVSGIKVLAHRVDNLERGQMRTLVDNLRAKLGSGVVVLGSASEVDGQKKVALIVGVTKDLTARVQAGKIIAPIAQKVGGSGGGRPDMAEAGGKDPGQLDAALREAYTVVESILR